MARYSRLFVEPEEPLKIAGVDPAKFNELVKTQYFGNYRLGLAAGKYLDYDFRQTSAPSNAVWKNQYGAYGSLGGYWIFRPDVRLCWQAENTCGRLRYWNHDGQAGGNPEDWELFIFEADDAAQGAVKVRNVYGCYLRYDPNQTPPYSPTDKGTFVCDTDAARAQVFYVDFC